MRESYRHLNISIQSLANHTNEIIAYLDRKELTLVIYPQMIETDTRSREYCSLLSDIKKYAGDSQIDEILIAERLVVLPSLNEKDFKFYLPSIYTILFFIVLPLGLIVFLSYYFKIQALQQRLRDIESTLGEVQFILKKYQ